MSDELVIAKKNGWGGARPGAGGPMNRAKQVKQLELMRHHGRRALMVALRKLSAYLTNPESKVDEFYLATFKDLADRCGLARGLVVATGPAPDITPEMMADAVKQAAQRIESDPDEGEVRAVCADFEVITPNGNGDPAGTVQ